MLEAAALVLLQTKADDPLEFARNVSSQFTYWLWFVAQDRRKGGDIGIATKGTSAGSHFIEDRSEGENIGTCVDLLPLSLFGRHVGNGSDDRPFFGARRIIEFDSSCWGER